MFDPPAFSVRHSRAGGNPDLGIWEIFRDCCNLKLLDSRLRGNDGGGFSKARCSRFQTTICLVDVHCSVGFAHDNGG